MSSTPYRMPEPESRGRTATIGKSVKIIGQIFTKEDLYVDGDVEGTIESQENKVTVGPNGRVQASIKAREVIILGQVQGNVETSDKVDLRKDAKLVGDITTARISIEDGAIFKGSIDIRSRSRSWSPRSSAVAATPAARPGHVNGAGPAGVGAADQTITEPLQMIPEKLRSSFRKGERPPVSRPLRPVGRALRAGARAKRRSSRKPTRKEHALVTARAAASSSFSSTSAM